jgi:hypothetical protein
MGPASEGLLSPTPHYYEVRGRAAEIARALGGSVGAEHLFLGMLHDGGWPVSVISPLVDLDEAEAAVLGIMNSPGFSAPRAARSPARDDRVQPWGTAIATEMGDAYIGLEHALVAIIRSRDTIPARALAGLADLDAVEAAVVQAKNAPSGPSEDAVYLPEGQAVDGALLKAISDVLPEGTTFGVNRDAGRRAWIRVFGPGGSDPAITRQVLTAALASLGRATVGS